jgi:hypothetical protein
MNRLVRSTVSDDGVLHLDVPVGAEEANREVQVTVESLRPGKAMTQEEWREFVLATGGSITDPTFERPPQGVVEQRDPLS